MALSLTGSMSVGGSVAAAGFALQNQNGAGNGYAYAGAAAVAQDASTIYFNPAGMTTWPRATTFREREACLSGH